MEQLTYFISNFLDLSAEASPWLLLGLLIAGLMKSWVPSKILSKHLAQGKSAIVKAALIGAPLPLCSCGVIPVATELKRSGASNSATSAFLVATPETGVDSVSVSYALLGPVFAIYRPFAAIMSAIVTGWLVATIKEDEIKSSHEATARSSCCSSKETVEVVEPITNCCSSKKTTNKTENRFISKTKSGIYYASTKLIDDIIIWVIYRFTICHHCSHFLTDRVFT